jgi:hypothetical protein
MLCVLGNVAEVELAMSSYHRVFRKKDGLLLRQLEEVTAVTTSLLQRTGVRRRHVGSVSNRASVVAFGEA